MSLIDRVKSPGEIYVLLVTFIFTEQFDRNLDLEAVEEGAIKNFLEISHSFLDCIDEKVISNIQNGQAKLLIFYG